MTMSNGAVAKAFANGATKGASRNMHIEGDTIYSYGPHFPIAKRITGGYVFNSDNCSSSTAGHKSAVWGYITGSILWEVPGCDLNQAAKFYADSAFYSARKIPKSRTYYSCYLQDLETSVNKAIEATNKLGLSIQPLYNVMADEVMAKAMKRIKREGEVPKTLISTFGKAQFLSQEES